MVDSTEDFTPSPSDIEWQRNCLRLLRIGGTWIVPMNGAIIEKTGDKTVKFNIDPHDDLTVRMRAVITAAGWIIQN